MSEGSAPGLDRRRSEPRLTIPVLQPHSDDRFQMPDVNRRPPVPDGFDKPDVPCQNGNAF